MRRRTPTPENCVKSAVLDLLAAERIWYRRLNTGAHVVAATETTARRFVSYGSKGMADILATPIFGLLPVILWIETKAYTKQSQAQKDFQAEVTGLGHYYLVAKSSDDVFDWLKTMKEKFRV